MFLLRSESSRMLFVLLVYFTKSVFIIFQDDWLVVLASGSACRNLGDCTAERTSCSPEIYYPYRCHSAEDWVGMLERNKTEGEGKEFVTQATTDSCIAVITYTLLLSCIDHVNLYLTVTRNFVSNGWGFGSLFTFLLEFHFLDLLKINVLLLFRYLIDFGFLWWGLVPLLSFPTCYLVSNILQKLFIW